MRPIDRIDAQILELLQKNARSSNKELAAHVGIAQSTCLERVRRMVSEGILRGFHAEVAPEALGIGIEALIAVQLSKHQREAVESFQEHTLSLAEVLALFHMAGENDFLVHVAVHDAAALRELAMTAFASRPEVVHLQTMLIFQHQSSHSLPVYCRFED
ncbi:MAG: Lrp/AsnC family transcriptional regulator [Thermoanaerobaculia bacterium]|nr:Lrp/AsnC family transcriptional regulator [Thermoanaerobaculia bacterium]